MAAPRQAADGDDSGILRSRLIGAAVGFLFGSVVGSVLGYLVGIIELGPAPMWLVGSAIGVAVGLLRPPRAMRPALPDMREAVEGQPAPVGALAAVTIRELRRPTAIALVVGTVVGLAAIPAAGLVYAALDARPSLVVIGLAGVAGYLAAAALAALLPALLLPARARAALAAHTWLGAREVTRGLGSRFAAAGFPVTPAEVEPWIASHPETDANREVHIELHLMVGDLDAAAAAVDRLAEVTPRDRFTRALQGAMVDHQRHGVLDVRAAEAELARMPAGPDRVEATVALAVVEARRRLPSGDWQAPLAAARAAIDESDLVILVRDFGWVNLVTILRRTWLVIAVLMILTLGLGIPIDLAGR